MPGNGSTRTRGARRAIGTTFVVVVIAGSLAAAMAGAGATPSSSRTTAAAVLGAGRAQVQVGVVIQSNGRNLAEVDQFDADARTRVSIVQYCRDFAYEVFEPDLARRIAARYGTPMVMLAPLDPHQPATNQPAYSLANIIAGHFDAYLHTFARAVKQARVPILLRFAHEMNGHWYPWAESVNGNRRGEYVRAWRHVHNLFVADGATNAKWVWSPNVSAPGYTAMRAFYPGDAYVDWVALDGYNWGLSPGSNRWESPSTLFDSSISEITAVAPTKPLMLAEVGSAGNGPDKAAWINSFFRWLPTQPRIKAFVWENMIQDQRDWRIESSPQAMAAFATGVAGPRYVRAH